MARRTDVDFPLWWHPKGGWARKVRQKVYYFGRDKEAALAEWIRVKDELLAGRPPKPDHEKGLPLDDAANLFLDAKLAFVECGKLSLRSYEDCRQTCKRLLSDLGRQRTVESLRPTDFASLWAKWAKAWGPTRLGNEVQGRGRAKIWIRKAVS